jgi:PAS domain S-box-containing protein
MSREKAAGVSSARFVSDSKFWQEARAKLVCERKLRKLPVVLQSADGTTMRKALVTSTLVEENGERIAVNLIEDLTAEEAARAALDRSEKRFATVFRASPIGMVITDFDHATMVEVNQAFLDTLGFKREEVFGASARDAYVDPQQHVKLRERMSAQGVVHDYPITIRDARGNPRDLLLSAVVFREGEARLSVNMVVDVTEQVHIREALKASEERFSRAFQFSPIGMTITRVSDGRILEVNKADERVLGYTQGETIGRTTFETGAWISTADRDRFVGILRTEGRVLGYETRMRNKAGDLIDARIFAEAMEINGEPCILGAVLNVTEEKRQADEIRALNESLERRVEERTAEVSAANAELEAFVYAVSHDLRGPLRAVNGFAELLKEELGPECTDAQVDMVDRIRRGGERMDQLIEDLLRLSRIGRQAIRRVSVDLSAIAREVLGTLAEADPTRVAECHIADGMTARCDAALVRIVLENLLGNAWKYTTKRETARIEFRAEPADGGGVRFIVSDNGAGFDMRYVERLFKPFSRLHTDAQFEGTGIGLSTVKRILVRHGGTIGITAAPGEGAIVRFTLGTEDA